LLDFLLCPEVGVVEALEEETVELDALHHDLVENNLQVSPDGHTLHLAVALDVQSLLDIVLAEDTRLDTVADEV
jgi:hypothetical protein